MVGVVFDVDKDADQVIAVRLSFVPPEAANRLRLRRNSSKALLDFEQSFGDEIIGHRHAIIEPKRQQDLVSPE
jgi:hypothetical protein